PCHFLWMSATLGGTLLATKDREDAGIARIDEERRLRFDPDRGDESVRERLAATKTVEVRKDAPPLRKRDHSGVLDRHQAGRMSLVILNTVPLAGGFYRDLLAALDPGGGERPETVLLHSRFRPPDRERQLAGLRQFLDRQDKETGAFKDHPGIVV